MSDKYKLTGEEINQILMHSPHALSLTPSERGMSGEQIKRFFYDFIRVFAEKLNLHLEDVEGGIDKMAQDAVTEAENRVRAHNEGAESHVDIRRLCEEIATQTEKMLIDHEGNEKTHTDIRQAIGSLAIEIEKASKGLTDAIERAEAAYGLASGKTRVHIDVDFRSVFSDLQYGEVNEGDIIMVTEKGCPDFVVASDKYKSKAVEITEEMVVLGTLPDPLVGEIYYYQPSGKVIIAIESGADTDLLAGELVTKQMLSEGLREVSIADAQYTDNTVQMAKSEIDLQIEEMGTALEKKTEAMPLLKEITLTEDIGEVTFEFDKPVKEFFIFAKFGGAVETEVSKPLRVWTSGGSQYFVYKSMGISKPLKPWACHAKEMFEQYWQTIAHSLRLGALQGISSDTSTPMLSLSYRRPEQRYVSYIKILIMDNTSEITPFVAGSNFKVYGREVDE